MSAVYTRRVSFDSLNPNIQVEPDEPMHIPPQYLTKLKTSQELKQAAQQEQYLNQSNKRGLDLNFGYEPSSYSNKNQDLLKVFDSFQEINNKLNYKASPSNGQLLERRKKIPKLPPPPTKSILKKQNYHLNYDGDNAIDETQIPKTLPDDSITSILPSQQRKKSIVEMTPEELLAMDQQYKNSGVNLDKFEFDGDNYLPLHNLSSLDQSNYKKNKNNLNNVDKLVGNIVTVNNKKLFKSNNKNINFKSYSVSFRHGDMTNFIQKHLGMNEDEKVEGEKEDDDNNVKQTPENLRDLIIYISGRKHTWDSINWVLKNFLVDGDHLIVISQLPTLGPDIKPDSGFEPLDQFDEYDDDEEIASDFIKEKVDSLSSYIFKCIEMLGKQDLKISITIEFIKDKSVKNLIKNSINLYNPNFFLVSSLISNRLSIKFENNHVKLPFYLMKNLNLSTIIIPDLLIDKNSVALNKDEVNQSIPNINIESSSIDEGDEGQYLSRLNNISDVYKNAIQTQIQLNNDPYLSRSNSNSNTNTNSSTNDLADTPSNYYPNNSTSTGTGGGGTRIKFSDNLSIPRYNGERSNSYHNNSNGSISPNSSSQFSSPLSSRRNSNNSSGIYKIKSLLEDDVSTKTSNSSSYGGGGNNSGIERSKSIPINERRMSTNSISSKGSRNSRKSKSVDEGTPKKSGFLAKLGFKKK